MNKFTFEYMVNQFILFFPAIVLLIEISDEILIPTFPAHSQN